MKKCVITYRYKQDHAYEQDTVEVQDDVAEAVTNLARAKIGALLTGTTADADSAGDRRRKIVEEIYSTGKGIFRFYNYTYHLDIIDTDDLHLSDYRWEPTHPNDPEFESDYHDAALNLEKAEVVGVHAQILDADAPMITDRILHIYLIIVLGGNQDLTYQANILDRNSPLVYHLGSR